MGQLTKEQRGDLIATAVWRWLQSQKAVEYVPWVTDPASQQFDAAKAAAQNERKGLLDDLERTIVEASEAMKA